MKRSDASFFEAGTRSPIHQDRIVAWVRDRITQGRLAPGAQLPIREQMVEQFQVSYLTVQRAMRRLAVDGFVRTQGRAGTFVVDHPPHLHRFALTIAAQPQDYLWSNFWNALSGAARRFPEQGPRQVASYLGVDGHADSEDLQKLQRDLNAHRLAGVILGVITPDLVGQLDLESQGIPMVSLMCQDRSSHTPQVFVDRQAFYHMALTKMVDKGCHNIALIVNGSLESWAERKKIERCFEKHHLKFRPHWVQGINPYTPQWADHAARLLMNQPSKHRPDGLIITDDNLTASVAQGLQAAGVAVPEDLFVISQCNVSMIPKVDHSFCWLGYDMKQLLDRAMDCLEKQRAGRRVAQTNRIAPAFVNDLESATKNKVFPIKMKSTVGKNMSAAQERSLS